MPEGLRIGDDLCSHDNIEGWYGIVDRKKVEACSFTKVRPGDIIGISFESRSVEVSGLYSFGMLFLKVVESVRPVPAGIISKQRPGQIVVAAPNGNQMNLLEYRTRHYDRRDISRYYPSKEVLDFAQKHGYIDIEDWDSRVHDSDYNADWYVYNYRGYEAELQDDMLKEKQRREQEKAAEAVRARAAEERAAKEARARVQDAARHAAARREIDALFSKM